MSLLAKIELKMSSFQFFFNDFDRIPRRATLKESFLPNDSFYRAYFHGCFCILCFLWFRNSNSSSFFFNFLICLHPTLTNVLTYWRKLFRFIMLHCKGMENSLSCEYTIIVFLASLFLISCDKLKTLPSHFKFHMG